MFHNISPEVEQWLYPLKLVLIGPAMFGLFIGAIYFAFYLRKLSKLPKDSREYKHQSEHMIPETLLRYIITIICIFLMTGLVYFYFEAGRQAFHLGALCWLFYFVFRFFKQKSMKTAKSKAGSY